MQHHTPQQQPPKKSRFWLIVSVLTMTLFGSCASFCGYEIYQAQTPEGKRETQERELRQGTELQELVATAKTVRAALPAVDAPDVACPSGHALPSGLLVRVVDTYYLDALAAQAAKTDKSDVTVEMKDELAASTMIRSKPFSDSIFAEQRVKNGGDAGIFGTFGATTDVETIAKSTEVIVIRVDEMASPTVEGSSFTGGELTGSAALVDWKTAKVLCHHRFTAVSSNEVKFGGGVRLKMHGIPGPAVGGTDFEEAVKKDFRANVEAAWTAALRPKA
jgi:hypothetical protein